MKYYLTILTIASASPEAARCGQSLPRKIISLLEGGGSLLGHGLGDRLQLVEVVVQLMDHGRNLDRGDRE